MNKISQLLLILPVLSFSFAGFSQEAFSQEENDFVGFASQGNLAQLRKIDTDNFSPAAFALALMMSVDSEATKTTSFLLSMHKFNPIDLQLPLMSAATEGLVREVEMLISHGAKIDAFFNGETPLIASATKGHTAVAELLVSKGANPDLRSPRTGLTAYETAKQKGFTSIAKIKGLRPRPNQSSLNSVITAVVPYVATGIALVVGYLWRRVPNAIPAPNPAATRPQGRGLVLRLAPDPRSAERAAPIRQEPTLENLVSMFAILNQLPEYLRPVAVTALDPALRAPAHLRPVLMAAGLHLIQRIANFDSERIHRLIEDGKNTLWALILAKAQEKLQVQGDVVAAPAA